MDSTTCCATKVVITDETGLDLQTQTLLPIPGDDEDGPLFPLIDGGNSMETLSLAPGNEDDEERYFGQSEGAEEVLSNPTDVSIFSTPDPPLIASKGGDESLENSPNGLDLNEAGGFSLLADNSQVSSQGDRELFWS